MPRYRQQQALLAKRTITRRVLWLIRLRWMAAVGVLTVGAAARFLTPVRFNFLSILIVSGVIVAYNAVLHVWARRWLLNVPQEEAAPAARTVTRWQILADLTCLTILLQCTGGIINPFVVFMVFHMAIAGIMLPRQDAFQQAGVATTLLGLMTLADVHFPQTRGLLVGYPLEVQVDGYALAAHPLFAWSLWAVLSVTFFLTAYLTSGISVQLKETYRALAEAYEELHRREVAKSQFMRIVAHEMRSPLAAISSLIDLLDGGLPAGRQPQEIHARIKGRCESMMKMVDDLLRLAHVRAGVALSEEPEPVDFAEMVQETCEGFHDEAAGKSLEFCVDAEGARGAIVLAPRRDLRDLVANLVGNAIKYTPNGGQVRVTAERQDDRVSLRVADTGIGIPQADQDKLFQEFYRGANAKRMAAHSSGLGLSIVRSVVDKLSGEILLESQEGQGTIFTIHLPVAASPVAQPTEAGRS